MSLNTDQTDRKIVLTYSPHGNVFPVERVFDGATDDDMVFAAAGITGRRAHTKYHGADLEQLKALRNDQMAWYAQRMVDALYDGLGRWRRLIPLRVRVRIVQMMMDYLHDITTTWTNELVSVHAEKQRTQAQARALRLEPGKKPRSAPENGPRILCVCCDTSTLLAPLLPEGWTSDDKGGAHCPQHPARVVRKSAT